MEKIKSILSPGKQAEDEVLYRQQDASDYANTSDRRDYDRERDYIPSLSTESQGYNKLNDNEIKQLQSRKASHPKEAIQDRSAGYHEESRNPYTMNAVDPRLGGGTEDSGGSRAAERSFSGDKEPIASATSTRDYYPGAPGESEGYVGAADTSNREYVKTTGANGRQGYEANDLEKTPSDQYKTRMASRISPHAKPIDNTPNIAEPRVSSIATVDDNRYKGQEAESSYGRSYAENLPAGVRYRSPGTGPAQATGADQRYPEVATAKSEAAHAVGGTATGRQYGGSHAAAGPARPDKVPVADAGYEGTRTDRAHPHSEDDPAYKTSRASTVPKYDVELPRGNDYGKDVKDPRYGLPMAAAGISANEAEELWKNEAYVAKEPTMDRAHRPGQAHTDRYPEQEPIHKPAVPRQDQAYQNSHPEQGQTYKTTRPEQDQAYKTGQPANVPAHQPRYPEEEPPYKSTVPVGGAALPTRQPEQDPMYRTSHLEQGEAYQPRRIEQEPVYKTAHPERGESYQPRHSGQDPAYKVMHPETRQPQQDSAYQPRHTEQDEGLTTKPQKEKTSRRSSILGFFHLDKLDKAKPDKAKLDKVKPDKAKLDKVKPDKAMDKIRRMSTRSDKSDEHRTAGDRPQSYSDRSGQTPASVAGQGGSADHTNRVRQPTVADVPAFTGGLVGPDGKPLNTNTVDPYIERRATGGDIFDLPEPAAQPAAAQPIAAKSSHSAGTTGGAIAAGAAAGGAGYGAGYGADPEVHPHQGHAADYDMSRSSYKGTSAGDALYDQVSPRAMGEEGAQTRHAPRGGESLTNGSGGRGVTNAAYGGKETQSRSVAYGDNETAPPGGAAYGAYGNEPPAGNMAYGSGTQVRDAAYGGGTQSRDAAYGGETQSRDAAYGGGTQARDAAYGGTQSRDAAYGGGTQSRDAAYGDGTQTRDAAYGNQADYSPSSYGSPAQTHNAAYDGDLSRHGSKIAERGGRNVLHKEPPPHRQAAMAGVE